MDLMEALRLCSAVGLAYAGLVVLLRGTGNRTLGKLRAFDFVVTVALGSLLASSIQERGWVPTRVLIAMALLVGLQYAVAWATTRNERLNRVVTRPPVLLFRDGRHLEDAQRRERVTKEQVWLAMRAQGHVSEDQVGLVVLETNGEMTVLPKGREGDALRGVPGAATGGEEDQRRSQARDGRRPLG